MIRLIESVLEWVLEVIFGAITRPIMKKARAYGREMGRNNPNASSEIMLNLFRVGDYRNTLAMCNIGASVGQDLDVFKAHVLMQLGQLEEAVRILTVAVKQQKNSQLAALANCTLGEVYLVQDRLDAAFEAYNTALQLWPERGAIYRNLAEVWLRRNNRAETLRCARLAVGMERASPGVTPEAKASNLAAALAVLACAVAGASGDVPEVRQLASEAAGHCGGIAVTGVAQTHFYCAVAFKAIGDSAKSMEHLELAARVDPHGAWGRIAQQLMAAAPVH